MLTLDKEDHAKAVALANAMKANLVNVPPKIAVAAVYALVTEIVVHLSAGKKVAALDMVKSLAHDLRDSVRAYYRNAEERAKREAAEAPGKLVDASEPRILALGTKEKA